MSVVWMVTFGPLSENGRRQAVIHGHNKPYPGDEKEYIERWNREHPDNPVDPKAIVDFYRANPGLERHDD